MLPLRAHGTLVPVSAGPWTVRRIATTAALPLVIVVALPFAAPTCGSCMGYEGVVMDQLNACPRATSLLGAPIAESYAGLSCGYVETEDEGRASWRMPVAGPRGSGVYHYQAVEKNDVWSVVESSLDVGEEHIEIRNCALAARGQGMQETRDLHGRVTVTTGPAPVTREAVCAGTIAPGAGHFGCRVVLRCGDTTLYGAKETSGFTECTVARDPQGRLQVTALDLPTEPSSDPVLDLRTATGEILIDDRRAAVPFTVRIRLDDAPPPAPPSPPPVVDGGG